VIRLHDVARPRGYLPEQNVIRQDGMRCSMLNVLKNDSASTLDVAGGVKAAMVAVLKTVTGDVQVKQFGDQSLFVTAAINGVVRQGVIPAALTGLVGLKRRGKIIAQIDDTSNER